MAAKTNQMVLTARPLGPEAPEGPWGPGPPLGPGKPGAPATPGVPCGINQKIHLKKKKEHMLSHKLNSRNVTLR